MSRIKAHSLAVTTRLNLGLQSTEFVDVYKAITTFYINCVKRPLESTISGATITTSNDIKVILINSSKSIGHQNFTIAHELYHCLHDNNMTHRTCMAEVFSKRHTNEQIADWFATYLLMPEDAIYYQLALRNKLEEQINIADIVNLEQYFSVSRKAMCWRLEELRLITKQDCDKFSANVIRTAKVLGKDTALYLPSNKSILISDYAEIAYALIEKGVITQSRYEEILMDAGLADLIQSEGDISIANRTTPHT